MKKVLILNIFLFIAFNAYTQHILTGNLVPNSSFEEYTQCPDNWGQINYASPWFDLSNNNGLGTSEYFNFCSTNYVTYYSDILQFNQPYAGNGCVGFFLYWNYGSNWREYIEVNIKNKLIKNRKYCVYYHTILSKLSNVAIKNIDLFFSNNYFAYNTTTFPYNTLIDTIPQIRNKNGIISDTVNWIKISGIYDAYGGEEYIILGNFDDDNHTNWMPLKPIYESAYYLIDDVSVCECSFDFNLGPDTTLCVGESMILMPNLPNAVYTWQDSSHAATYEVKQPGTYWVRAYVAEYDITSTDTIVITGGDDNICNPPLTIPNVITPNGDSQNDNFVIQNAETYEIALQIYNRWGNLIFETTNYQNDFSCTQCADGVYFYVLKAKSKRNGREKEYKGSLTVIK
jgi:gliding motility-associated-like protein